MAKKRMGEVPVPGSGGRGVLYTNRASALPQLTSADPNSYRFLNLTLDDLGLLRDLYQSILDGYDVSTLPQKFGESRSKCYELLGLLPVPEGEKGKREYKKRVREAADPTELPEVVFHDGLRAWLDHFAGVLEAAFGGIDADMQGRVLGLRSNRYDDSKAEGCLVE